MLLTRLVVRCLVCLVWFVVVACCLVWGCRCCLLFVVVGVANVAIVRWLFPVVVAINVCCLLFAVCCLLFVVCCWSSLWLIVCCLAFVVDVV